jgi:hypothetical protein
MLTGHANPRLSLAVLNGGELRYATRPPRYGVIVAAALKLCPPMPFDPQSSQAVLFKNNAAVMFWLLMAAWIAGLV